MTREINIETPLRQAAREGVQSYQPRFDGIVLERECCDPAISLYNLLEIINGGIEVLRVEIVENGYLYVTLGSGLAYLATGLRIVGRHDKETQCLAEFLAEAIGGEAEAWLHVVVQADYFGNDYRGVISVSALHNCGEREPPKLFSGE